MLFNDSFLRKVFNPHPKIKKALPSDRAYFNPILMKF
jgi:hypothetical protein